MVFVGFVNDCGLPERNLGTFWKVPSSSTLFLILAIVSHLGGSVWNFSLHFSLRFLTSSDIFREISLNQNFFRFQIYFKLVKPLTKIRAYIYLKKYPLYTSDRCKCVWLMNVSKIHLYKHIIVKKIRYIHIGIVLSVKE